MLILDRPAGSAVWIGNSVRVEIAEVRKSGIKLRFDAPRNVPIIREEIRPTGATPADTARQRVLLASPDPAAAVGVEQVRDEVRGIDLRHAASGADALDRVAPTPSGRDRYSMVLLDDTLADIASGAITGRLRAAPLTRHLPILVLSEARRASDIRRHMNSGATAVLPRPARTDGWSDLLVRVASLLTFGLVCV